MAVPCCVPKGKSVHCIHGTSPDQASLMAAPALAEGNEFRGISCQKPFIAEVYPQQRVPSLQAPKAIKVHMLYRLQSLQIPHGRLVTPVSLPGGSRGPTAMDLNSGEKPKSLF